MKYSNKTKPCSVSKKNKYADCSCDACVDCCPGHCDYCGAPFDNEIGGKIINTKWADSYECAYKGCTKTFHLFDDYCNEGYLCPETKRTFCKIHKLFS